MTDSHTVEAKEGPVYETDEPVLYQVEDAVATITLNRPRYHNSQNSQMTYALDEAFKKASNDDAVKVIVLRGSGKHFSAGHDIGTPGRDIDVSFDRQSIWYDHADKEGGEFQYVREQEVYLGMCRRWRDIPKPTIAMVHGACIAGGLMLAWICDMIVASEDAFFADPVIRMGIPGVEYFAHPYELNPRIAKEFLFLGERMSAQRAYDMGMLNHVVATEKLEAETYSIAKRISVMPRFGLMLTKQAVNHVEDLQGKRSGMDAVFAMHHVAHMHNAQISDNNLGGHDAKSIAQAQRGGEA